MNTIYSTHNPFTPKDIERTLDLAAQLYAESNGAIEVCIYLMDKDRYFVLDGVNFLSVDKQSGTFQYNGTHHLRGAIYTYRKLPTAQNPIIVIAVCVTDHELSKLENNANIKAVLVVPDYVVDCANWLTFHNATNLEDGQMLGGSPSVSTIVRRAIGWLISEKRSIHHLDNMHIKSYIESVANVVNRLNGVCAYDDIVRHCIERGLFMKEAITVAGVISKVPKKGYPMNALANLDFLVTRVDDAKWENVKV